MPTFQTRRTHLTNRSGITLLATMSMIVLFMLLGTAFVMVSARFMRTSKYQAIQIEKSGDSPQVLLRRAFLDFIRGQRMDDVNSPLRGIDLLSDQYGFGLGGVVSRTGASRILAPGMTPSAQGQIIVVDVTDPFSFGKGQSSQFSKTFNRYAGQVFTFITGQAKHISTRVVGYEIVSTVPEVGRFYLMPNWDEITGDPFSGIAAGDRIVLNGAPFDGRGGVTSDDGTTTVHPSIKNLAHLSYKALLPYQTGLDWETLHDEMLISGVNECYDIADYLNPFLAMEYRNPAGMMQRSYSFHNPTLIQHLIANAHPIDPNMSPYGLALTNMSTASLRPAAQPGRVDSTYWPALDAPPEIDSDGDGVLDSVWIDIGLPVQTDKNGKTYKPLVAVKIIDLDGRLNVNAHGSNWEALYSQSTPFDRINPEVPLLGMLDGAGNPDTSFNDQLPLGMGMGPAEISLRYAFSDRSDYLPLVNSRYGADGQPGVVTSRDWLPQKHFGHPAPGLVGGFYSSQMDWFGRFVIGFPYVDPATNPQQFGVPVEMPVVDLTGLADELTDSPYEMVLGNDMYAVGTTDPQYADAPYSAKEMERILRRYDRDSRMLPPRLTQLLAEPLSMSRANLFTHASFEVPALPRSIVEKLNDLLQANGYSANTPAAINARKRELLNMLAWDTMRNLPMDVNRPFGNGIDDDDDGQVDEYTLNGDGEENGSDGPLGNEEGNGEVLYEQYGTPRMDHDNDGRFPENYTGARQLFARNLFVLSMVVLTGDAYQDPNDTSMMIGNNDCLVDVNGTVLYDLNGDGNMDDEDIVALAQWCVNVVDFRDPDSICTRFEFDTNPFDGWTPNRYVYGAERPEMLISEGTAIHDKRTEDLNTDPSGEDVENDGEEDFDSRLMPRASAFIELYNPWTWNDFNQQRHGEVHDANGVDLDRLDEATGTTPVWRLMFVRDTSRFIDPDNQTYNPTDTSFNVADISRTVYFADPTAVEAGNPKARWTDLGVGSLAPGQYAVIGSSGIERRLGPGRMGYQTPIGRLQGAVEGTPASLMLDDTRGIMLVPSDNQIILNKWDPTVGMNGAIVSETRDNVIAVAINQPRSLGLTDPDGGYPLNDPNGAPAVDVGDGLAYPVPYDDVLDTDAELRKTGVTQDYNVVHLQRLANPLEPYNAATNPYLTFDSHWVDLNTFNGVADDQDDPPVMIDMDQELRTVERGWKQGGKDPADIDLVQDNRRASRNIWRTEIQTQPIVPSPVLMDSHFYSYAWSETFGQMNQWYRATGAPAQANTEVTAFPWFAWNNRPYVSGSELALVPHQRPSKMLDNFSLAQAGVPYNGASRFGHLPNFFHTNRQSGNSANLYRIFDYIEVPSRFVGTEQYLNPNRFVGLTVNSDAGGPVPDPLYGLNPPFNYISRYRNPGKININTLSDPIVWQGLMGQYAFRTQFNSTTPSGNPANYIMQPISYDDFFQSRQSRFTDVSQFGNPYRSANASNYVARYTAGVGPSNRLVTDGADCGLFRRSVTNTNAALYDLNSSFPFNDSLRNATPRFLPRTRVDNMVTTRSSVFAIWVTLGKFEVDYNGTTNQYTLGGEVGIETGDIKRHRAFYMFDRSIPVAYEPGKDHNVERAIIAETIIE